MASRTRRRDQSLIWPGFVDAVTTLLMVLMFVLTIFTVMQSVLRDTITTQDTELNALLAAPRKIYARAAETQLFGRNRKLTALAIKATERFDLRLERGV